MKAAFLKGKGRGPATILVLLFFLIFFFLFYLFVSPYPALKRFQNRPVSTRVYDRDGYLLQILALEDGLHREYVPLDEIPPHAIEAFIQAEDRRFFYHHGIDFSAIFRALFQNASQLRTVSGASTITMQLSRLIKPHKSRNLFTKSLEALDALRLESRLSKKEILQLYLNNLPFGFNCQGVASASRTFFNTDIRRINEKQSLCLSVIPRRPATYNPLHQPEHCARAAFDLNHNEKLTFEDLKKTAESARSFSYPFEFPHYLRYLAKDPSNGLYRNSEIYLSASLSLQKKAENLLAQSVNRYRSHRISNGAVLVVDNRGQILCWAGSGDFFDEAHRGQIDGVLTCQQPGSSMKPFLYALALESGYEPNTVLPDVPLEFGFDQLYLPQNFNNRYSGPVRMRVALASSLNVPAVYLLNEIGLKKYIQKLFDLGFDSLQNSDPGLGLALGNGEVSLFELVQAFSVFPRDGLWVKLNPGISPTLTPPLQEKEKSARVFDSDTARIICSFLSDDAARAMGFGYHQLFQTDYPSIFKTGTANQFQTITALGATSDYTVGVWMGNFTGETIIGKTGSSIPAAIARQLLDYMHSMCPPQSFLQPSQYRLEEVCSLSGLKAGENCPATVYEYLPLSKGGEICSWHSPSGLEYPARYSSWFRLKNRKGSINNETEPLKIVSPRSGSVFLYNPGASQNQNLTVEALGGRGDKATVYLDGAFFAEISRPFLCQIPLKPGNHQVTFTSPEGDEESSISFQVK